MLYYENLEEIIFTRHQMFQSDELVIISGYVGPTPISRLKTLPFNCTVIYGMYGIDGIQRRLHQSLIDIQKEAKNINIYYSNIPIHAKCYLWLNKTNVAHALIGSANFSINGLTTPYREVLAETTTDTFHPLGVYMQRIRDDSILCLEASVIDKRPTRFITAKRTTEYCRITLLDPVTGEVPPSSGLNWGQSARSHVTPNDAYIPIRAEHIQLYPELFPPKQDYPRAIESGGRAHRHNDAIEILWDDRTSMLGLLEGSVVKEDGIYPKQISSAGQKKILGSYVRQRINVPSGARITRKHLEKYGRTHIDVSLQGEGVYYFDFAV